MSPSQREVMKTERLGSGCEEMEIIRASSVGDRKE
jgi:hypothetical protein